MDLSKFTINKKGQIYRNNERFMTVTELKYCFHTTKGPAHNVALELLAAIDNGDIREV
jgi:glycerol-3-phosphate cytidylyltransferase-like family protein